MEFSVAGLRYADVVFDETTKKWRCCGTDENGIRTCDDPTDISFDAPGPQTLLRAALASGTRTVTTPNASSTAAPGETTTVTYLSAPPETSTPPPTVSPPVSSPEKSSNISPAAAAGITIAAVVFILALIGAWFFMRVKRRRAGAVQAQRPASHLRPSGWYSLEDNKPAMEAETKRALEMEANSKKSRTRGSVYELSETR